MATGLGETINKDNLLKAVKKMLFAGGLIAENEIVPLVPVDNGRLKGSITASISSRSDEVRHPAIDKDKIEAPTNEYECYIGTNVHYAVYMEYGTGSHKTIEGQQEFIENVTQWATRRGLPPFPIINSIRKKGLKARAFMRNGFKKAKPKILNYYNKHFSEWICK